MNGWVISGIVLICLGVVASFILMLRGRQRERAGFLKRIDALNANILTLAEERNTARGECNLLRTQLTASREQVERMMGQHDQAIAKLRAERDALRLQLEEALRPKSPPPSDGTRKPRTSKVKPTSLEPPSMI